jgi:uncharacterized membrane protein YgaE (UPF0421/DUF939 family)
MNPTVLFFATVKRLLLLLLGVVVVVMVVVVVYSPNILQVIKSRRMRWAGACSTCGRQKRCIQGFGGET